MDAEVVHGAVVDMALVTLQVTVPLVTVIVANTGAEMVRETTPVELANVETGRALATRTQAAAKIRAGRRVTGNERLLKNRVSLGRWFGRQVTVFLRV
jgi:hypothetical protein